MSSAVIRSSSPAAGRAPAARSGASPSVRARPRGPRARRVAPGRAPRARPTSAATAPQAVPHERGSEPAPRQERRTAAAAAAPARRARAASSSDAPACRRPRARRPSASAAASAVVGLEPAPRRAGAGPAGSAPGRCPGGPCGSARSARRSRASSRTVLAAQPLDRRLDLRPLSWPFSASAPAQLAPPSGPGARGAGPPAGRRCRAARPPSCRASAASVLQVEGLHRPLPSPRRPCRRSDWMPWTLSLNSSGFDARRSASS